MERHILFICTNKTGVSRNVQRYSEAEMAEVFDEVTLARLNAGQVAEISEHIDAVDLVAHFDKSK